MQGAVDEAREQVAAGKEVPGILGSLVSAVDESGNKLTDEELGDNLLLILLAGHDTSSTTLTNAMAHLQVWCNSYCSGAIISAAASALMLSCLSCVVVVLAVKRW